MVLDEPLRGPIAKILEGIAKRWPDIDLEAIEEGNRKQATIPHGATILEPVGTAPGLVVPPADGRDGPTVVVLPGPPRELQPMWAAATATEPFAGRHRPRARELPPARCCGCSGSRSRRSPRRCAPRERARHRPRRARDHDLPAPRRGRGRDALRARRRSRSYDAFAALGRRAPRRHAVLRRRALRRSTSSPTC